MYPNQCKICNNGCIYYIKNDTWQCNNCNRIYNEQEMKQLNPTFKSTMICSNCGNKDIYNDIYWDEDVCHACGVINEKKNNHNYSNRTRSGTYNNPFIFEYGLSTKSAK